MKERVISGILIAAILGIVFYFGGIVFDLFAVILAILAYKELIEINNEIKIPIGVKIFGAIIVILLILANTLEYKILLDFNYETLSFIFLALLAPTIFIKEYSFKEGAYLSFVTIFISTIFNLLINVYNNSFYLILYVIIVAMATDVFALFGGKLIGKHKLTKISPKKTIEGSVVGTLFSCIISTTYYMVFIGEYNIITIVLLTIVLSVIGQIGDIFFSLIKRENEKKDFSNLIPGHGGILDRIDSIIFVLIAFTFIIQFL